MVNYSEEHKTTDKRVARPKHPQRIVRLSVWFLRFIISGTIIAILLYGSEEAARAAVRFSPLLFLAGIFHDLKTPAPIEPSNLWIDILTGGSCVVIALCLIKKRFFCRYACPVGLCVDVLATIRRTVFRSKFLRYGVIFKTRLPCGAFALVWAGITAPLFLHSENYNGTSPVTALAFDPLSLLSRTMVQPSRSGWILFVFILCFILSPYFWRFQFCPCGALQELLYYPVRLVQKVLRKNKGQRSASNYAIQKTKTRRAFFETCGVLTVSVALIAMIKNQGRRLHAFFFRPPGALPEEEFLSRCSRCGRCVISCPNNILTLVDFNDNSSESSESNFNRNGDASYLTKVILRNTPQIDFQSGERFCEKKCNACGRACPTGAISLLTFEEKAKKPIAVARFKAEHCMLYFDQECSICRRECPYEAIDFVWSDEEYLSLPTIDEKLCVGCGRCVAMCPGEPVLQELGEYVEAGSEERIKALSIVKRA